MFIFRDRFVKKTIVAGAKTIVLGVAMRNFKTARPNSAKGAQQFQTFGPGRVKMNQVEERIRLNDVIENENNPGGNHQIDNDLCS